MGNWGTSIFSDDIALDIKDIYKFLLGEGLTSEEATQVIIAENKEIIEDPEDGTVFWLALSATQWKYGRLLEEVKEKAIYIIDNNLDLDKWKEEPQELKKRKKVLDKLKVQLNTVQPQPSKVKKQFVERCELEKGDVISYRLLGGNFIILVVHEILHNGMGTCPLLELRDWIGTEIPEFDFINKLPLRDSIYDYHDAIFSIQSCNEKEYPLKRIQIIAKNIDTIELKRNLGAHTRWKEFDAYLKKLYRYE